MGGEVEISQRLYIKPCCKQFSAQKKALKTYGRFVGTTASPSHQHELVHNHKDQMSETKEIIFTLSMNYGL